MMPEKIQDTIHANIQTAFKPSMQLIINGKANHFDVASFNVAHLVTTLALEGKRLAIECNGEIVPRSQFAEKQLIDGDKLEIVGAVGGG